MISFWTSEDRLERLIILAKERLTSAQIAAQLSSEFGEPLSRCAVLGKANRKGIDLLGAPGASENRSKASRKGTKPTTRRPRAAAKVVVLPAAGEPPTLDTTLHREFMELDERTCHWPVGGDLYCGAATEVRKSYCATHGIMARRTTKLREAGQLGPRYR